MTTDIPLKPLAEAAADRILDTAFDDPIKLVEGIDSLLSLAAKVIPTTPEQFPVPIPLGIYNHIQGGTK